MTGERERVEELAALVAAGAASEAEERELAALAARSAEAAAALAAHADVAAMLVEALEPIAPPPDAFARIQRRVVAERRPARPPRLGRRRAAMAVTLAAAAALALLWWRERDRRLALEDDLAAARTELQGVAGERATLRRELAALRARYDVLRSPGLRLATVANDRGATMKIFVDQAQRRWLVLAFELPPLPADRDYQLWFLPEDGGAPVSGGLLELGPDGTLSAAPAIPPGLQPGKAAVSIEPRGGSASPTLDQIQLIGELI